MKLIKVFLNDSAKSHSENYSFQSTEKDILPIPVGLSLSVCVFSEA